MKVNRRNLSRLGALLMMLVLLLPLLPQGHGASLYTVKSTSSTTLAPGITQKIHTATYPDDSRTVKYYVATADINHSDVMVNNGYFYYFTLDGLTAVQMNDKISSVLYGTKDGQPYYSPVDEYSIATYAYAQLNKTDIAENLKILCADLLRYGSKAQIFNPHRSMQERHLYPALCSTAPTPTAITRRALS